MSRPLAVTPADTVTIAADRLDDLLQRAFRAADWTPLMHGL